MNRTSPIVYRSRKRAVLTGPVRIKKSSSNFPPRDASHLTFGGDPMVPEIYAGYALRAGNFFAFAPHQKICFAIKRRASPKIASLASEVRDRTPFPTLSTFSTKSEAFLRSVPAFPQNPRVVRCHSPPQHAIDPVAKETYRSFDP